MNLIPSAVSQADSAVQVAFNHKLSLGLALLLIVATLAGATALVAVVSDIFVESVQKAAEAFGMTPATPDDRRGLSGCWC